MSSSWIRVRARMMMMGGGALAGWTALAATPAEAAGRGGGGARPADLAPPLLAAGAAGVAGWYGNLRRRRRTGSRGTPGRPLPTEAADLAPEELAALARAVLTQADDCVQSSREELVFVEAVRGAKETGPYARAVREAEAEVRAGFRGVYDSDARELARTQDEAARRQALGEALFHAREAGRLLDEGAPGVDRLRGLEQGAGEALEAAQSRFRALTGRTGTAARTLARLRSAYPQSAMLPVVRNVEEAQDRLVFTTSRLNRARQAADMGDDEEAVVQLRAAEGAIAQTAVLVNGVERLAAELTEAEELVAATLDALDTTDPEKPDDTTRPDGTAAADAATGAEGTPAGPASGDALDGVRAEVAAGGYDPPAVLRRLVAAPPGHGGGPALTAALHVARSTTSAANDYVTCHRGAVGAAARARLAEARGLLARAAEGDGSTADAREADELALRARQSAEEDVRAYAARHDLLRGGTALRAVLGGILLPPDTHNGAGGGTGTGADGGAVAAADAGVPPCYGGPATRARLSRTPPVTGPNRPAQEPA